MKFRPRSDLIIDAAQFIDGNFDEMKKWIGSDKVLGVNEGSKRIAIDTLLGAVPVEDGDWVVKGPKGLSVVKQDEFEEKYERVV